MRSGRTGTPQEVRWLTTCTSGTGGRGSIPGQVTKIPHGMRCGQTNKSGRVLGAGGGGGNPTKQNQTTDWRE